MQPPPPPAWGPPPPGGFGPAPPGFGGYGPPQGLPPGYQGPGVGDLDRQANFWFVAGIVIAVTGLCCLLGVPLGIAGAYFGHEAKEALRRGDLAGAESKIQTSRICGFIAIAIAALMIAGYVGMMVLGVVARQSYR